MSSRSPVRQLALSGLVALLGACAVVACSPKAAGNSTPPTAGTGTTSPPSTGGEGTSGGGTTPDGTGSASPEIKESDCPPRCSESGAWVGCGLEKPRGKDCGGCVPRCKSKGTPEEGWYDCSGVFIATAKCAK
jgi:hypothetical protein